MRLTALALVALVGCGEAPTSPVVSGPLAGLTLRAEGSLGVLAADGTGVRVGVVYVWELEDSTYVFKTDWPGPREVRTSLPDDTVPYRVEGNYWVECDPGHRRACLFMVERLSGQAWSWQDAGMSPVTPDMWMADVVIGNRMVRLGPMAYEIVRDGQ